MEWFSKSPKETIRLGEKLMEEFPEQGARAPRVLPPVSKSFDIWEGPVDPRKSAVGAIEQSRPGVHA